jgi:hypothetical protein
MPVRKREGKRVREEKLEGREWEWERKKLNSRVLY